MILADRIQELSNYDKLVYVYDHRVSQKHGKISNLYNFISYSNSNSTVIGSTNLFPSTSRTTTYLSFNF